MYYGIRGERKYPVEDRYYWFRTNVTQVSALMSMQEGVQDIYSLWDESEGFNNRILPQNPLSVDNDLFLDKIEACMSNTILC